MNISYDIIYYDTSPRPYDRVGKGDAFSCGDIGSPLYGGGTHTILSDYTS